MNLGWQEILGILVIVMLLFGAKRLPELGKSLGEGIKEFKKSTKELARDDDDEKKKPKDTDKSA